MSKSLVHCGVFVTPNVPAVVSLPDVFQLNLGLPLTDCVRVPFSAMFPVAVNVPLTLVLPSVKKSPFLCNVKFVLVPYIILVKYVADIWYRKYTSSL